jgi:hypothetical protein
MAGQPPTCAMRARPEFAESSPQHGQPDRPLSARIISLHCPPVSSARVYLPREFFLSYVRALLARRRSRRIEASIGTWRSYHLHRGRNGTRELREVSASAARSEARSRRTSEVARLGVHPRTTRHGLRSAIPHLAQRNAESSSAPPPTAAPPSRIFLRVWSDRFERVPRRGSHEIGALSRLEGESSEIARAEELRGPRRPPPG